MLRVSCYPPSVSHIKKAIKKLKNIKAVGIDVVPGEIIRVDLGIAAEILRSHITSVWKEE